MSRIEKQPSVPTACSEHEREAFDRYVKDCVPDWNGQGVYHQERTLGIWLSGCRCGRFALSQKSVDRPKA